MSDTEGKKKELDGTWGVSSPVLRYILYVITVAVSVLVVYPILLFGVIPLYVWMYINDYFDNGVSTDLTVDDDDNYI